MELNVNNVLWGGQNLYYLYLEGGIYSLFMGYF